MQVANSHSLRCPGIARCRTLSDSEQRLTGMRQVRDLYVRRRHHQHQRSNKFTISSYQETAPAQQEGSTLSASTNKGGEQYKGPRVSSRGTTIFSQRRERLPYKFPQRSSDSPELVNNIAPVTVRARAAWRMLGRGRQAPSIYQASLQTAAVEAATQAGARISQAKLASQSTRKLNELSPAVAEAALAPLPSLLRSWEGLHKPVGLVLASAHVLFTACALTGVEIGPAWLPAVAGGLLGGMYAGLNRVGMRRLWKAPTAPLSVVITGGTKGIGKALAREFLRAGDSVVVTSRTTAGARQAAVILREEVGSGVTVHGVACDVSSPGSVARLASVAGGILGRVDVWINNAGCSGSFQYLVDASPEQLAEVVQTNLLGSLLCTRAACRLMELQETGGHVFNMDGAGADGQPTPQYVAYGATKAGIAHLMGSLQAELSARDSPVMIHTLSPGMVLTDLLLDGATDANKQIFNILCEHPETVAAYMVPRLRTVVARGNTGSYIRYLTIPRALMRFLTAPLNSNRYFDSAGNRLYGDEMDRISGQRQRRTERLAVRAARRSRTLGLAYSLSMAASLLIFVSAAGNVAGS